MFGHILRGYAMTFSHQKQAISMVGTSGYYYNQYCYNRIHEPHIIRFLYIYIRIPFSISSEQLCIVAAGNRSN